MFTGRCSKGGNVIMKLLEQTKYFYRNCDLYNRLKENYVAKMDCAGLHKQEQGVGCVPAEGNSPERRWRCWWLLQHLHPESRSREECWGGCSSPCSTNHMLQKTVLRCESLTASAARTSLILALEGPYLGGLLEHPFEPCDNFDSCELLQQVNFSCCFGFVTEFQQWLGSRYPRDFSAEAPRPPGPLGASAVPEYHLQVTAISPGGTKAAIPADTLYIAFHI